MPITTNAELMSAASWYPAPVIMLPSELLDDLGDLQQASWVYRSLTLSEGGYIPAMAYTEVSGAMAIRTHVAAAPVLSLTLADDAPMLWESAFADAALLEATVYDNAPVLIETAISQAAMVLETLIEDALILASTMLTGGDEGMALTAQNITLPVAGDDHDIRVLIPNIPAGQALTKAWFTAKAQLSDTDEQAIVAKEVTTTGTSDGHITDDGAMDMEGEAVFALSPTDTKAILVAGTLQYDVQVLTDAGKVYTVINESTISVRPEVTLAVS